VIKDSVQKHSTLNKQIRINQINQLITKQNLQNIKYHIIKYLIILTEKAVHGLKSITAFFLQRYVTYTFNGFSLKITFYKHCY